MTLPVTASVPASGGTVAIPAGVAAIPHLVAQVALRAVQTPDTPSVAVIRPPRRLGSLNAPAVEQAILATTSGVWATGATLTDAERAAASAGLITSRGAWTSPPPTALLPAAALRLLHRVNGASRRVAPLFGAPTGAGRTSTQQRLAAMWLGVQRCESSWLLGMPRVVERCAHRMGAYLRTIRHGVRVVARPNSTYTLASQNSSLPVTVANSFDVPVWVDVTISTVAGVPGLTATEVRNAQINPGTRIQLPVRTHVDRTGRIAVQVRLTTRAGMPLGRPVVLSIHSTALGTIGVVITAVAGVVLALALLVRVALRLRRRTGPVTSDGD